MLDPQPDQIIFLFLFFFYFLFHKFREEMEDVTMSIFDLMGCAEDTGSLSNFLVKQKVVEVFQVNHEIAWAVC